MAFKKSKKQAAATDLMKTKLHTLLYGGSRSGKTFIFFRNLVIRALQKKSDHAILRRHFTDVHKSVWEKTYPDVINICFPQLKPKLKENKSLWFIEFPNKSRIWIGGLDTNDDYDKILGNEYSTIYYNECSEMSYSGVVKARTRLAENSGLSLRFWYDCNPPKKNHWIYKEFVKNINPHTGKQLKNPSKYGYMLINPDDNPNLPEGYIEDILEDLPYRERRRFLLGLFQTEVDGALWNEDMIAKANNITQKEVDIFKRIYTVVALDPTTSDSKLDNDECGVIVLSKDTKSLGRNGNVLIEADLSGHYTTTEWAKKAASAYKKYNANVIIAEGNQGGELVKNVIHKEDPLIKVIIVHARQGKYARAEPTTVSYEQQKVKHVPGLERLEDQLTEYTPADCKESPGRLDSLVWGLSHLYGVRKGQGGGRIRTL